ncbi:Hypothetical protein, putative [Bodo saltans]|uniref:Uncharacterized protein n=1 Tax=Bodo saltans TaxID=75058 RepID=A0A0S4INQ6_BODSA|nr:Hypothetical protein, putative [Bodo saltans]|eukprot:CUE88501.1 Hypothetical protein, putative [Bodo saltans]
MKDYMSTYANPSKSILTSTIDSVNADVGVKDANTAAATALPVALHVPQRKRNTHDASSQDKLGLASLRTTSRLQTQQHSRPSGGLLHPLHHSTTASSSGVRDEESKSQLHRFACMFKWTKEYPANGGGALSVQQWSPMLLRDVNKEVDPEGGHRPHPLRVAASMHVVEAAFKALHIPMSFFEDLESAVYVAHSGISTHHPNTLSHKKSSSPLDVTIDLRPVPRLFAFEALRDATTQRRVLSEKAVCALTQFDTMHQNLDTYVHRDKAHKLFQHFAAWRCLTRV